MLLLSGGNQESVFSSRALLQEKASGSGKKLPDGVLSTWSTPSHTVTGYVMDTHIDDPAIHTDYNADAWACGGISPGPQQRGLFNTTSLSMLAKQ